VCGDMNARTAELDDYIRLADLQDYLDVPDEGAYLNAYIPKGSNCDKSPPGSGTWGCELLIVNGRTLGDVKGEYTFTSPRGQSTIDYFVVSAEHLSSVADMKVMHDAQFCNLSCDVPHDGQKSDHFPLQLDLACTISTSSTNARSSPSQPSTCPQFKYVESQVDAYQQCLTAELLMHLVPLLTGTIDVDTVVAILITCMTEAAQQI